ncbi:MAG TPA: hypothetical protein VFR37_18885 [Longimicrobium sp.]|nr:hypothetical protein [Longimicrobium sp.]
MAFRIFYDRDGCEWQVWDVVPGREVESGSRRHHYLPPEMVDGWLCFEASDQKRRLTPYPADWEEQDDASMDALCRAARPVTFRQPAASSG